MKNLLLFFILILLSLASGAQNYNVVLPYHAQYFAIANQSNYYPSPNWSPVKVMYFDSVVTTGQANDNFTFHTWLDTINTGSLDCIVNDGPAWTGNHILEMNNGISYFFNLNGDTITLKTNAAVNDTWKFMDLPNGGHVDAGVISISNSIIAGIQDSVKTILLLAIDSSGTIIANHPINTIIIQISKSNGFFQTVNFRDLPDNPFQLHRIDSVPMTTWAKIYDFDVGDEFEYYSQCNGLLGQQQPPVYDYIKILSKYFSPSMDSVYYTQLYIEMTFVHNPNPPPYYNQVVYSLQDTIRYAISNSPFFTSFPEQNLFNTDSSQLFNYTLQSDSGLYHSRPQYTQITNILWRATGDSCIRINHFEAEPYTDWYALGLGHTGTEKNELSQGLGYFDCRRGLVWYHKNNETFGTYTDLTAGIETINFPFKILISPNPVNTNCYINIPNGVKMKYSLTDLTGRIFESGIINESTSIDMTNLSAGVYLLSLSGNSGNVIKKIIKE